MKIVIWIAGGIALALVLLFGIGVYMFNKEAKAADSDYIIDFIKENAAKENVALSITYNDENWASVNKEKMLPLASTVKIIVAIEYAQQAAQGKIDPNQQVSIQELEKFYIAKTDGGAHEAWLAQLQGDSASLQEIAKGMIGYSSNANTDYLINVLGLENINQTLSSLGLLKHDPLYPIVSAQYVPAQLMREQNLTKKELLKAMQEMDMEEYRRRTVELHNSWLTKPLSEQDKKQLGKVMDLGMQKIWSDRLPRSTTEDYVTLMNRLNNKTYFSKEVYQYLDPVMEQLMESEGNRKLFTHAGQKGGSTVFVLTVAMYATDKKQNKTELAFFSNDLSIVEQKKLSQNLNSFQLKFLTDAAFRDRVKSELAN
ncbi:serine hydrolase [Bacillus ndiopicus]|uniref:serine hydrolase n=1 Tax=Bacillus ndiopicus TaxID=1347368 RepID=UPI0005A8BEB9|nr:serine hydrolase [Bacillus ndiopicus]